MFNDLVFVFFVITGAICLIVLAAFLLQKWSERHRFPDVQKDSSPEEKAQLSRELSEKIRFRSTLYFPTFMIDTLLPVPHSKDVVVMLAPIQSFRNLLRCKSDGSIIWIAELPEIYNYSTIGDVYTHVAWDDQKLKAFSWSCYSVVLDPKTGKIITTQFTK
jgi:hypothetical protein